MLATFQRHGIDDAAIWMMLGRLVDLDDSKSFATSEVLNIVHALM